MRKTILSGAFTRYVAPQTEWQTLESDGLFLELSGGTEPITDDDFVYNW